MTNSLIKLPSSHRTVDSAAFTGLAATPNRKPSHSARKSDYHFDYHRLLVIIFALVFLFGIPTFAQLPSHVEPIAPVSHAYDRFDKIELGVAIGAATFDVVQTCHNLANGGHEDVLPTQHCPQVSLILFGQVAAQEVMAQVLRKTGHRQMARAVRLYSITANTKGILYSKQHGAW